MRQCIKSASVLLKACCLCGVKPIPKQILAFYHSYITVHNFESKYENWRNWFGNAIFKISVSLYRWRWIAIAWILLQPLLIVQINMWHIYACYVYRRYAYSVVFSHRDVWENYYCLEGRGSLWSWSCCHWQYWRFSLWKLLVQLEVKVSSISVTNLPQCLDLY